MALSIRSVSYTHLDVYKRQIRTRSYDDQTGAKRYVTEIFVDNMEMLSPRNAALAACICS